MPLVNWKIGRLGNWKKGKSGFGLALLLSLAVGFLVACQAKRVAPTPAATLRPTLILLAPTSSSIASPTPREFPMLEPSPTPLVSPTVTGPSEDCEGPFCRTETAQTELLKADRKESAMPLDTAISVLDVALREEITAYLNTYLDPTQPLVGQTDVLDTLRAVLPNAGDDCILLPTDLDGDASDELVVWKCANMPVGLLFTVKEDGYVAQSLPVMGDAVWAWPQLRFGTLDAQDVTGDDRPELLLSYILPGGSMMTGRIYFLAWSGCDFETRFSADLVDWVGRSTWALESNPAGAQDVVLRYPHLYFSGFDAKLIAHPWATQRWRWDPALGRYTLHEATRELDFESNLPDRQWEEDVLRRLEWEWMRVLVNEAELHYQAGGLEEALASYQSILSYGAAMKRPEGRTVHWPAYARFRVAQVQAMLGQTEAAQTELSGLMADLDEKSNLRPLVQVFDEVYDPVQPDAALRAMAALHGLHLYEQFYWHDDRPGDITFPMNIGTLLWPGTPLAHYLGVHPEAVDGPTSPEQEQALLDALSELGFPVTDVRIADLNADGLNEILVTTDETEQHNGPRYVWLLAQTGGRWRSHRWPKANTCCSPTEVLTEEPLSDGRIVLRWGETSWTWMGELTLTWTGEALVEVDPETYEPLPPPWPRVGSF